MATGGTMMAAMHNSATTCASPSDGGLSQSAQESQVLDNSSVMEARNNGTSNEELLLPPPMSWFSEDLAAAAPSSDEEDDGEEKEEDSDSCCFEPTDTARRENSLNQNSNPNNNGKSTTDVDGDVYIHRDFYKSQEEQGIFEQVHSTIQHSNSIRSSSSSAIVISPMSSPSHLSSSSSNNNNDNNNNKTPPLENFRSNPSLSPPRVMAAPSPSWKEISSQVLPAAAKELFKNSFHRICYTARITYSKGRWHRKYSDLGNNSGGYFRPALGMMSRSNSMETLPQISELPPFSSLRWVDRQMVREWRTYLPEEEETPIHPNKTTTINETKDENQPSISPSPASRNSSVEAEDMDFDRARTLVPLPLPRPRWQKADICYDCQKPFGPTRLRHHCRLCGYSFCQLHSASVHRLPHLGYDPDVPERVCDPCKRGLLAQNLAERVAWRLARCRDLEAQQLTPYFETGIDTMEQAALRIAHAALATARSIPLGAQAHVAVETVEVLRKHGLNGIYGIMLRKEFLAAADLLRKALGINKTAWPLSVHELSAAIFYALAQHRAMRGINPDREEIIHALVETDNSRDSQPTRNDIVIDSTDEYDPDIEHLMSPTCITEKTDTEGNKNLDSKLPKDTMTCASSSELPFTPVCTPVPDHVLNSLIFYAPIALTFIYATKEVDMQLLAAQQGWKLLYACLDTDKDREGGMITDLPASAMFVHEQQKTACLAVRGTATIHDVVTDVRQMPVSFPEMDGSSGKQTEGWTNVITGKGLAVCGMASAAVNLFREHMDVIMHLVLQGYRIRITGHSLGGGVATLLGVLILKEMEQLAANGDLRSRKLPDLLRVYTYGPPSSVDANLAEFTESFVTTVVLHDDVVPRLTPTSCRGLLKHLLHIRETWVKAHLTDDLMAIGERASLAWAPRWRSGFTLASSSRLSLRKSSRSIKHFCQKKLQSGTEQLLSVQGKLIRGAMAAATGNGNPSSSGQPFYHQDGKPKTKRAETTPKKVVPDIQQKMLHVGDSKEAVNDTDELCQKESKMLVEVMGGINTVVDAVVIDGDEFFEADENLIESEEDSIATTEMFVDAFDEARNHEFAEQLSKIEASENKNQIGTDQDQQKSESDKSDSASHDSNDDDEGPGAVFVEDIPLPRMFVPGKIVHIYAHRGVFKATYVPRAFRELRRISLAGNMLTDHTTADYYESLLEVRSVRNAQELPPKWTAFDEDDTCSCCASRFTWASTSDSEAQEARDKHNCRSCGSLVCDPCATNRVPLPSIGVNVPVRVCDRCYNDLGGILTGPSNLTSSLLNAKRRLSDENVKPAGNQPPLEERPERQRERRSAVVDDLARRIQRSALAGADS